MKESDIEKLFNKKVKEIEGYTFKIAPTFEAGLPDRCLLYKGEVYFVELKTEKGKLSIAQIYKISEFGRQNVIIYVLYGINEVNNFFKLIIDKNGND